MDEKYCKMFSGSKGLKAGTYWNSESIIDLLSLNEKGHLWLISHALRGPIGGSRVTFTISFCLLSQTLHRTFRVIYSVTMGRTHNRSCSAQTEIWSDVCGFPYCVLLLYCACVYSALFIWKRVTKRKISNTNNGTPTKPVAQHEWKVGHIHPRGH